MNEINTETIKATMPLITDDELNTIDNNLHSITDDFLKHMIRDKELYLAQYIMKKLGEENQDLKKQLEKTKATNKVLSKELTKDKGLRQDCLTTCCGIPIGDIPKLKTQQEEFIKYLEDSIKVAETTIESLNDCRIPYSKCKEIISKEILSKYKEIIGSDKE